MPVIIEKSVGLKGVLDIIKCQTPQKPALFLWGKPGIGKSAIVAQAAAEMKIGYIKFDASMRDPTDIRGVMFVVDGKAKYLAPDDLPEIGRDGQRGILFADELLFAVPAVQNNMHSLIWDRMIGNYKLPKEWIIVAASNRQEDRVQIYELSGPLSNRFCHIMNIKEDYDEWALNWAVDHDISPLILSFLKLHPNHFCQNPDNLNTFATPRSWQFANEYLTDTKLDEELKRTCIAGCVGPGIEEELHRHKEIGYDALKVIEEIKRGNFPDFSEAKISLLWVINIYFANLIKKDPKILSTACEYVMHLGDKSKELAIHMAKLGVASNKKIAMEKKWLEIAKKYNKYLEA